MSDELEQMAAASEQARRRQTTNQFRRASEILNTSPVSVGWQFGFGLCLGWLISWGILTGVAVLVIVLLVRR